MHKKEAERAEGQGPGAEGKDAELVAAARERLKDLRLQAVELQLCLENFTEAEPGWQKDFVRPVMKAMLKGKRLAGFTGGAGVAGEFMRNGETAKRGVGEGSISEDEYYLVQQQLLLIGKIASGLNLKGFIRAVENAENVGCFVMEPGDYQKALPRCQHLRDMAKALNELTGAYGRLHEEVNPREQAADPRQLPPAKRARASGAREYAAAVRNVQRKHGKSWAEAVKRYAEERGVK